MAAERFSISGRELPASDSIGARLRALLKNDAGPAMLAVPNPKLIFRRNLRLVDSLTVPSPVPDMTISEDAGRLYPVSRFWDQYFQAAAFTLTGIRKLNPASKPGNAGGLTAPQSARKPSPRTASCAPARTPSPFVWTPNDTAPRLSARCRRLELGLPGGAQLAA